MEQAAIKSGAMGPPDRRLQGSKGSCHAVLGDAISQGPAAIADAGAVASAEGTPHGGGTQNQNISTLLEGGAQDSNNGAVGAGNVLGATTVKGYVPPEASTTSEGLVGDENLPPSSGDSLEQIYQSTRTWCRTLRRSPNAMEVLLSFESKNPRPHSGILFNQYLSDLTGIMYRRLSTTVEEEVSGNKVLCQQKGRSLLVGHTVGGCLFQMTWQKCSWLELLKHA